MVVIWPLYTTLHGPTSYDLNRHFLGGGTLFWGAMMEGVSSVLIVAGLVLWRRLLVVGKLALAGYIVTLIALAIPALLDLVFVVLVPPMLQPALGIGLVLIAAGNARLSRTSRVALVVVASLLIVAVGSAFIPPETSDPFYGYRWYGLLAYELVGIGWIAFALSAGRRRGQAPE